MIQRAPEKPFVSGWKGLPRRLRDRLTNLADNYRKDGVELFLFGSFAREDNRRNSDLDIGVIWHSRRSREVFNRLVEDIENLPTIRKIDVVDLDETSPVFRDIALAEKKTLAGTE